MRRLPLVRLLQTLTLTACFGAGTLCAHDDTLRPPLNLNLPSLGTVASDELSPDQEYALGRSIMGEIRQSEDYLRDPEITAYLNELGFRLVSNADTYTYRFEFFGVKDPSLNAFALPGGFIAVNTGTIVAAQTESELAGVMGHEIGHVAQRHIARMIEDQKKNLPLTIGSILLAILAAQAGGDSGAQLASAVALGSQAALIQRRLSFSQGAEREADRIGMQTLSRSGFDPAGMQRFFERLQNKYAVEEVLSSKFLSTHPLTSERIADMENRARSLPVRLVSNSLVFELIQKRAQLLQTVPGPQRDRLFTTWTNVVKGSNEKAAVPAAYGLSMLYAERGDNKSALHWAERAMARGKNAILERNLLLAKWRVAKASERKSVLAAAKDATQRYPFSRLILNTYLELLYEAGDDNALIKAVRSNPQFDEGSTDASEWLAKAYTRQGKVSQAGLYTAKWLLAEGRLRDADWQLNNAQRANDADFYVMSRIDALLRQVRELIAREEQEKNR